MLLPDPADVAKKEMRERRKRVQQALSRHLRDNFQRQILCYEPRWIYAFEWLRLSLRLLQHEIFQQQESKTTSEIKALYWSAFLISWNLFKRKRKSWHCILNYSFSNKTSSWLTILGCKISYCKNCRLSHATRGIHFPWLGQGWSSVEMLDMRHTVPSASKCCDAYRDQTLGRRGCLFLSVLFKAYRSIMLLIFSV